MGNLHTVLVDPVDPLNNDGQRYDNVLRYKMLSDRVFYIAGIDFEQWVCLHPGQAVQVTKDEV